MFVQAPADTLAEADHRGSPQAGRFAKSLVAMHDGLDPEGEVLLVDALRWFARTFKDTAMRRATTCSGTNIAVKVWRKLMSCWSARYDIWWLVEWVFHCEKNFDKQEFLKCKYLHSILLANIEELMSESCTNLANNDEEVLAPHLHSLDTGVPCQSRTPQSSKAKSNMSCVQEKRSATGRGIRAGAGRRGAPPTRLDHPGVRR